MGTLGEKQAELSIDWEKEFCRYESVIASQDKSLKIQATVMLADLSNHAPESILARAIPILVELLRSPSDNQRPSIQEASAYCLKCIACQGEGRLSMIIGHSQAIPCLLSLLKDSEGSLRKVLLKCLRNIVTFGATNGVIVFRNGGLEIILDLLNAPSDGLRRILLEILSALALLKEARPAIYDSGNIRLLVESVVCGNMISRTRAAYAIGCYGFVKRVKFTLFHLGVVGVLIDLMRNGDTKAKLVAANALGVISTHVGFIRPVAEAGAIPLLAEMLEECGPSGKEIVLDLFCFLAMFKENATIIFAQLVRILRGNNNAAKEAAVDVIWVMSGYKHFVAVVRNSGVIPVLVELLTDDSIEIKETASGAVAEFSYIAETRLIIADSGAFPFLVNHLEDESEVVRDNAAETLVNFSEDPVFGDRISRMFDDPSSFQTMHDRGMQICAAHNAPSEMDTTE